MSEHVEYAVGFALSHARVALIRKNRPAWQAGKLNGIGGHVEHGETPYAAMCREFHEETGTHLTGWEPFVVMDFPGAQVTFYRLHVSDSVFDGLRTTTDEEVVVVHQYEVASYGHEVIPNLRWLIPLAAYTADRYHPIHIQAEMAEALTVGS